MPRTVICESCGKADALGGAVEARIVGGMVLPARCRDRRACLQRRFAASVAYSGGYQAVREARS